MKKNIFVLSQKGEASRREECIKLFLGFWQKKPDSHQFILAERGFQIRILEISDTFPHKTFIKKKIEEIANDLVLEANRPAFDVGFLEVK